MSDESEYIELDHTSDDPKRPDTPEVKRRVIKNKNFIARSSNVWFEDAKV